MGATTYALVLSGFLYCANALAQTGNNEPVAVVELGGTPAWNLKDASSSLAPTAAVELTPIENWLELEAGVTPIFSGGATEWDTDLVFKKPWTLSKTAEFMFGIGPEWIYRRTGGLGTNSLGGEVVLDFMFWPSTKHKFGWYIEPEYEYDFGRGHERSIGISCGLLIAIYRTKP